MVLTSPVSALTRKVRTEVFVAAPSIYGGDERLIARELAGTSLV